MTASQQNNCCAFTPVARALRSIYVSGGLFVFLLVWRDTVIVTHYVRAKVQSLKLPFSRITVCSGESFGPRTSGNWHAFNLYQMPL